MANRIEPSRLRALRESKNLTLEALARKARVAKETIYRIEKGRPLRPRATTLERLSTALGVAEDVLSGNLPLPTIRPSERDLARDSKSQFNVELSRAQHNAFVLVAQRYDIPMIRVAELAPFLFMVAAEQSLRWRKEKVNQLAQYQDQQNAIIREFPHLPNSIAVREESVDAVCEEEKSIAARDIFADHLPDRLYHHFPSVKRHYDETADNPFVRYLKHLASDHSATVEMLYFNSDELTDFKVCKDYLEILTGGDKKLTDAVHFGMISLSAMPRHLFDEKSFRERIDWMQSELESFLSDVTDAASL